jgi:hypothetical protein
MINFSDTHLSDAFKDVNGFRPHHYKEWWTEADLEAEYDRLQVECKAVMLREEAAHKDALVRFDALIQETIGHGAADRETAIRWLLQADSIDINNRQDVEHFFWTHGLSFEKIDDYVKKVLDNRS